MATVLDQAVTEKHAPYITEFRRAEAELAGIGSRSLHAMRRSAMERFTELGFPTARNEEWRFTSLGAIAGIPFQRAIRGSADVRDLLAGLPYAESRLVFVDGYYSPRLSTRQNDALNGSLAERHLGRYADHRNHPFVALNTAFLADAALIHVPAGEILEQPIHVIHVSTGGSSPQVSYPRNLIVLDDRSQASLIETYVGSTGSYFTNAVTEIITAGDAILDHYKLQMESDAGFHIATVQVQQGRGSSFRSHSFSFGGALARTEVNSVLAEGSNCTLNGLYVVSGNQHVDTRTSIDHAKPHGASHELYKGILNQRSSAVFNGRIIVRPDAQKTDAKQTNKNLVLSEGSTINTKPELQIHADDVRCTHGATIGQLDKDSLFYLRSRGIGMEQAREILIAAFAGEIIDGIKPESLRTHIEEVLATRLAKEAM